MKSDCEHQKGQSDFEKIYCHVKNDLMMSNLKLNICLCDGSLVIAGGASRLRLILKEQMANIVCEKIVMRFYLIIPRCISTYFNYRFTSFAVNTFFYIKYLYDLFVCDFKRTCFMYILFNLLFSFIMKIYVHCVIHNVKIVNKHYLT